MKFHSHTKGYSLVEVMVAITILMLSIVGPITITMKSYQSAQYARQQTTAFFLAQEGISAANTLRNDGGVESYVDAGVDSWDWTTNSALAPCFAASGCNIDFRDDTLMNNVTSCASAGACVLKFDTSAPRAAYQAVSGEDSPYTRIITFAFANPEEIVVESRVSWDAQLLGGSQEIVLSTSLFNLFKQ